MVAINFNLTHAEQKMVAHLTNSATHQECKQRDDTTQTNDNNLKWLGTVQASRVTQKFSESAIRAR